MNDHTPDTLDRLVNELPVGPAPVEELLARGRTTQRRRRRLALGGGALATGLVAGVALLVGQGPLLGSDSARNIAVDTPKSEAPTHEVRVVTRLEGPRVHYFEGALTEVSLTPGGAPDAPAEHHSGARPVGDITVWPDVGEGSWRLTGSTRPCNGSCDDLSLPTDTCAADLDVTHATFVVVTFRWGSPCEIDPVPGDSVRVPDVRGLSKQEAVRTLELTGLDVVVNTSPCPPGTDCVNGVGELSPVQGSQVPPGSDVTVHVYTETPRQ